MAGALKGKEGVNQTGVNKKIIFPSEKGVRVTEITGLRCVKPKLTGRKIRCVKWQGALKGKKGVNQTGLKQGLGVIQNGCHDVRRYYTGCPRRNVRDFGRVFLMLNYTDITQNTYVQSRTVTEIMARERCGLHRSRRTVRRP